MMTYFVGGVGVPDDEFAILRGRNQVSRVRTPMHSIHLQIEAELFSKKTEAKPWTSVPGGFCASSSVSARSAPCSPWPAQQHEDDDVDGANGGHDADRFQAPLAFTKHQFKLKDNRIF